MRGSVVAPAAPIVRILFWSFAWGLGSGTFFFWGSVFGVYFARALRYELTKYGRVCLDDPVPLLAPFALHPRLFGTNHLEID